VCFPLLKLNRSLFYGIHLWFICRIHLNSMRMPTKVRNGSLLCVQISVFEIRPSIHHIPGLYRQANHPSYPRPTVRPSIHHIPGLTVTPSKYGRKPPPVLGMVLYKQLKKIHVKGNIVKGIFYWFSLLSRFVEHNISLLRMLRFWGRIVPNLLKIGKLGNIWAPKSWKWPEIKQNWHNLTSTDRVSVQKWMDFWLVLLV
jgi:hypothetical protein